MQRICRPGIPVDPVSCDSGDDDGGDDDNDGDGDGDDGDEDEVDICVMN